MLTGNEIIRQVKKGSILIDPFVPSQVNPNSYNLRLGTRILVCKDSVLDFAKKPETEEIIIDKTGFQLEPQRLYLGSTMEVVGSDCFVPVLNGRSSIGRLGIDIHKTAGFGDLGFFGVWTLEIVATQPVIIYPGIEICQMAFYKPEGETTIQYKGKYTGARVVEASKLYREVK